MADPDLAQPSAGRGAIGTLTQTLYLLLGMLAIAGIGGVLLALLSLPAVTASSAIAQDGVDLFESYPSELDVAPLNESSRIEASDGSLLAMFYTENRIMVPLEEISPYMQHAVISVEDRRFYEHNGVDPMGMLRAFISNSAGGDTQGGSTLTQQYVKNALLMDAVQRGDREAAAAATEQTYARKLREAKLAISLEQKWTKDEVLNAYLNVAQFGPSQYGVETGSQHYFSKPAKDLNPGEAALLAGITNGPNQYDPVAHPEAGQKRRNEVLGTMLRDGYITQEEYDTYTAQPVADMLKIRNITAGCADAGGSGFFCDYATRYLLNDPAFGETPEDRQKLLYGGGLTIRTTLDPAKQKVAEDILERRVPAKSASGFGHSIVTVEPGTGRILTMAENRTFNPYQNAQRGETAINYNVPANMGGGNGFPVGSTFKPFVLTEWLKQGRTIYDKLPTKRETIGVFPASCLPSGAWRENPGYDPDNAVSVRLQPQETALNGTKFSVNTVYAQMARQLDLCSIADTARDLGAIPASFDPYDQKTWDMPAEDMYSTSLAPAALVLGEVNISALDMAAAYATFAASGKYCRPTPIESVTDRNGKPLDIVKNNCRQALDPEIADTVAWVLQQDLEDPRATGKGRTIPGQVAGGKTGTSGSQFHTWYVGFTKYQSTAVWFGHPGGDVRPGGFDVDGMPLRRGKVWGNTVSLPTWQEYMTATHQGLPRKAFPPAPEEPPPPPPAATGAEGTVPDVSGMVRTEAIRTIEQAGYTVREMREPSSTVEKFRIIGSTPAAGTPLEPGSPVTIRQSSGP